MTRRIILPSIGSRGDIQPYMVLASALQDKGYEEKAEKLGGLIRSENGLENAVNYIKKYFE